LTHKAFDERRFDALSVVQAQAWLTMFVREIYFTSGSCVVGQTETFIARVFQVHAHAFHTWVAQTTVQHNLTTWLDYGAF